MDNPPPPIWNTHARDGYIAAGLAGMQAYEDKVCRRVLAHLGLTPMAREIAIAVGDVTGTPACSFAAMDARIHFPVKFGVGKISGTKYLAVRDLFDKFTRLPLYTNLCELASRHGDDDDAVALALVFRYLGDTAHPGPKGGTFMTLHTFPSTPPPDRTRITRRGRLGSRHVTFTLETLEDLMRSFDGWATRLGE